MIEVFPYQLVAFLDKQPEVGESVYGGVNGWYPQIALKRRFNVRDMGEDEALERVREYCSLVAPFPISIGRLVKTDRMPVSVLEVEQTEELMNFHRNFIRSFGRKLISRYPERDGDHYYPHITAEYDGKVVIDTSAYAHRQINIDAIWILKDIDDEDSKAYAKFPLLQA